MSKDVSKRVIDNLTAIKQAESEGKPIVTVVNEDGEEELAEDEPSRCEICEILINDMEEYGWIIKNVDNSNDKEELWLCSEKCWNEWILFHAEEIREKLKNRPDAD